MKEFKQTLLRLQKNLDTLRQREAKYAGSAPLDLLNQIEDHETAIALTEQTIAGELTEADWCEALEPLLVHIRYQTAAHPDWGVTVGDVEGGIIGAIIAGRDITAEGDIVTGVKQTASGSNIAQATEGGTATVNAPTYHQQGQQVETQYNAGRDINIQSLSPRDKNLTTLMGNVRQIWVEDYLNSALLNAIYLDLGLTEKRDAGAQPQPFEELNIRLRQPEQAERDLPPGTQAIDVYKEAGGGLLILGQPGAGKTTTLATLTRDLLAEADSDPSAPIPIIFNLSSWTTAQKPLTEWLTDELNRQYQVSRKLGQRWLAEGHLALLLDGLDEVAADRREACVAAINTYRDAEAAGPLVVCSRLHDYEALQARLKLGQAIVLKKLTPAQIRHYFERLQTEQPPANGPLTPLAERILQDDALAELTETPLMLNIITVTYAHPDAPPLPAGGGEQLQTHIFEAYTQRMFNRVGRTQINLLHPKETMVRYLQYLAAQLQGHSLGQFSIGQIRGSWLSPGSLEGRYRLLSGLIVGLSFGLYFGLIFGSTFELRLGLYIGAFSIIGGLVIGLKDGKPVETVNWVWKPSFKIFNWIVLCFLIWGGITGLLAEAGINLPAWGAISILILLFSVLINGKDGRLVFGLLEGLINSLPIVLLGWLFGTQPIELSNRLVLRLDDALIDGLSGGLLAGLFSGLGLGLIFGLGLILFGWPQNELISLKLDSEQELRNSCRTVLIVSLIGVSVFGLIFGLFAWSVGALMSFGSPITRALYGAMVGGLTLGPMFGVANGGGFLIQHHLRLYLLDRHNLLPFKLIPFLDQCTELIFLQRLGGSYRFIHRSVQEHFAAQWEANERIGE